jgi:lysylphosphatidylglycerol synthetase-like protein (DUF2156 family)
MSAEIAVHTPMARSVGAGALLGAATWLAVAVAHDRHHLGWQDDRLAWSVTVLAATVFIARGIVLGRPVTGRHAALAGAAVLVGLALHVLLSPGAGNVAIAAAGLLLMWPTRARPQPEALPEVWRLVNATHGDALAPFAMHSLKSYHFSDSRRAAVAYRTLMGFAVVSGDPIGDECEFGSVAESFASMCRMRGWRITVLGCSERRLALWDATVVGRSMRAIPFGRDVVVEVAGFSLAGRARRNLRQAVQRTHNAGITTEVVGEQDLDDLQRAELTEVLYSSHRKAHSERGFSMILDGALEGRHPGVQIIVGRDLDGRVQAFARYATAGGGDDVSLDVSWRVPGAVNGIEERLSVDMLEWARSHGARRVSLAFAAFPEIFDNRDRGPVQSLFFWLIHLGDGLIRLESLYRYLRKYRTLGGQRYAVLSMRQLLPALTVLLTLEFLPRRRRLAPTPVAGDEKDPGRWPGPRRGSKRRTIEPIIANRVHRLSSNR